jgi:hypothetical protein
MGTTFRIKFDTGSTLYAMVIDSSGQYYNRSGTPAFEALTSGHLDNYAADLTEPSSLGEFLGTFPTIAAGTYTLSVRFRVGGSRAWTDYEVASGAISWTGTAFVDLAVVAANAAAAATALGTAGAGLTNLGDTRIAFLDEPVSSALLGIGSVAVNHNYPTANNLTLQTSHGAGIGGATIRAYLAAAYAINPITAVVRGLTETISDGTWANPVYLDPGDYTIVFVAQGYLTTAVSLTVA